MSDIKALRPTWLERQERLVQNTSPQESLLDFTVATAVCRTSTVKLVKKECQQVPTTIKLKSCRYELPDPTCVPWSLEGRSEHAFPHPCHEMFKQEPASSCSPTSNPPLTPCPQQLPIVQATFQCRVEVSTGGCGPSEKSRKHITG